MSPLPPTSSKPPRRSPERPDHVFISYSRENQELVDRLVEALERQGETVWIDREDIPVSFKWMERIRGAIVDARACVFAISRPAVDSEIWNTELAEAVRLGKRLVPIALDNVEPQSVPEPLRERHWARLAVADDLSEAAASLIETIARDPERVDAHTRLSYQAEEWERSDHKGTLLLRGSQLAEVERWALSEDAERREPIVTPEQVAYVRASVRARKKRRWATVVGSLSLVLLSIVAGQQYLTAEQRQRVAAAQSLAGSARVALGASGLELVRSTMLAIASLRTADTSEGRAALSDSLSLLPGRSAPVVDIGERIRSLAVSPDGRALAVGTETQGAVVCDLEASECPTVFGVPGYVKAVRFNNNGRLLFAAGADPQVWDLQSPAEPLFAPGFGDSAHSAISADFEHVAFGDGNGNVILASVLDGSRVRLSPFDSDDSALAFSPDGKWLTTGDHSGGIRAWRVPGGDPDGCVGQEGPLRWSHRNRINALAFLPEQYFDYVVAAGSGYPSEGAPDNAVRLWYRCEPRPERDFSHERAVESIAISASAIVASASLDQVRIFHYEGNLTGFLTAQTLGEIRPPEGAVLAIGWVPGKRVLATAWSAESGHTVTLSDPAGAELVRYPLASPVRTLAFSGAGELLVTGEESGEVRAWQLEPSQLAGESQRPVAGGPVEALIAAACERLPRSGPAGRLLRSGVPHEAAPDRIPTCPE